MNGKKLRSDENNSYSWYRSVNGDWNWMWNLLRMIKKVVSQDVMIDDIYKFVSSKFLSAYHFIW